MILKTGTRASAACHRLLTVYTSQEKPFDQKYQDEMSHRHTVHTTTPRQVVHPQAFVLIKEEFV
jgi:hypothetical protein